MSSLHFISRDEGIILHYGRVCGMKHANTVTLV